MWVVLKIRVPLLGTLNNRCCIIIGTEKGTIILTTTHVYYICMYFYTHLYTYVYVNIHIHLEELCIQSFVVGAYISLQPSQPGVSHRLCVLPCQLSLCPAWCSRCPRCSIADRCLARWNHWAKMAGPVCCKHEILTISLLASVRCLSVWQKDLCL